MTFGTQVRFVGDTSRALIGALADRGPLLVDVAEKKVLREYPQKGACADASLTGDLVAVFEPRGRRDDWLSIYAGDAAEGTEPIAFPLEALGSAEPVAFAPDGKQLVKTGVAVQLIDVATAVASERRQAESPQGSTFTPALRAWRRARDRLVQLQLPRGRFPRLLGVVRGGRAAKVSRFPTLITSLICKGF